MISYQPISSSTSSLSIAERAVSTPMRIAFWILGLLNNTAYVIMIASAKEISNGGTALVFLANVVPSCLVKLSAPYLFDYISYHRRLQPATICMMASFVAVGLAAPRHHVGVQLCGVALGSLQGGLGEASLLALAGATGPSALSSFASGTGMAGVFGFAWKWWWVDVMNWTLSRSLYLAVGLAWGYWKTFRYVESHRLRHRGPTTERREPQQLEEDTTYRDVETELSTLSKDTAGSASGSRTHKNVHEELVPPLVQQDDGLDSSSPLGDNNSTNHEQTLPNSTQDDAVRPVSRPSLLLSPMQRFRMVVSLWPYMIPLFAVYASEYALQAGAWTAMGFPWTDQAARDDFYQVSNGLYQLGVLLSRSSGNCCTAPLWLLWLLPALQCWNLGAVIGIAAHPSTSRGYTPAVLYTGALGTGLIGGAVYISGYQRILLDWPAEHQEFALSATSLAESIGIIVADALGLVIQACLYQVNGLEGAVVQCPLGGR